MALSYPNDFEVVWNGGALLPDRDSSHDGRWDSLPHMIWEHEHKAKEVPRKKRIYNKVNHEFWKTPVRHRRAHPAGETAAPGGGDPGHAAQHLPVAAPDQAATTTDGPA